MGLTELLRFIFFSGYLRTGMSTFPRPLSPSREKECITRMLEGDDNAKDTLIEHNLRLVAHIAKKYSQSGEQDDLISIGTIGLIKGVNSFNPEKNVQLATYISRCVENEILMYLRKTKKNAADVSLYEPIGEDKDGGTMSLADILKCQEEEVSDQVVMRVGAQKIEKYVDALGSRERVVILLRYGLTGEDPLPQREVAKRLGISRSYVSRIEKKALAKLRKLYEKGV